MSIYISLESLIKFILFMFHSDIGDIKILYNIN